jgi:transposase-like protein
VELKKTTFNQEFLREMLLAQVAHIMETAIKAEVDDFLNCHTQKLPESNLNRIVLNGYLPERRLQTPLGLLSLNIPRLRDRAPGEKIHFVSRFVPPYGRRLAILGAPLAWSYLRGLMSGDFGQALASFLSRFPPAVARGASRRLKKLWMDDHEDFRGLPINPASFQFFWAQAVPVGKRLRDQDLLVLAGVTELGRQVFLGLSEGAPDSGLAWRELFRALEERGLTEAPRPVVGAPDLGVWEGLALFYGGSREDYLSFARDDRLPAVLARLPLERQAEVEPLLRDISRAGDFSTFMAALIGLAGRLGSHFPTIVSGLMA